MNSLLPFFGLFFVCFGIVCGYLYWIRQAYRERKYCLGVYPGNMYKRIAFFIVFLSLLYAFIRYEVYQNGDTAHTFMLHFQSEYTFIETAAVLFILFCLRIFFSQSEKGTSQRKYRDIEIADFSDEK